MSIENAKKFFEDLQSDSKLQDELNNLLEEKGSLSEEQSKSEILSFANAKGYDFSLGDLDGVETSIFEFSQDELAHVAGGDLEVKSDANESDCAVLM